MLGSIIDNLMPNLYTGVYMNERSVRELKASMGHQQVLYLPSHRSYVDFCLMSYICFCYNLEIPCIAAGMDFHGMMVC
jgi:glyceronephosphate O-acyltransferase